MFARFQAAVCVCLAAFPASLWAGENAAVALQGEGAISAADIRPHVEYLASAELRGRGEPLGKALAGTYITRRFTQFGLQPLFAEKSFYQSIPGPKSPEGGETVYGKNIGAWLPGSDPALRDEFVIVSAHYDHLGTRGNRIFPGADDNASSVAMLLEVARQIAASPRKPRRSIAFLGFDLEENMLWGSRWFVAHPPWPLKQVKLFVTADLIGRSLGNLSLSTIFVMGSEHAEGLREVVASSGSARGLNVARLGVDLVGTRSDYGPFRAEKVPFLFFSSGEHPDYHTPQDTADRIDYPQVAGVSNLVLQISKKVADAEKTPGWTDKPEHDLEEVQTVHRITELLMERDDVDRAAGRTGLSDLQRFTVSNVKTQLGQIIKRGKVTDADRPWLVRSAQVLLFSVF